jgi:FtsZ-binding cell division protein ZapB
MLQNLEEGENNAQDLNGKMAALDEEVKILSQDNDNLRQENDDLTMKLESAEELVSENENLLELLRQIKLKLEQQMENNNSVWKRSQDELELKQKLADDINQRIQMIHSEANGETSDTLQYLQEEISKIHAENDRLNEENQHFTTIIEELKRECELLREQDGYD